LLTRHTAAGGSESCAGLPRRLMAQATGAATGNKKAAASKDEVAA